MLTRKQEFNRIYETHKDLVLRVAYVYAGDLMVAEDIMQEAFLKLYKEMEEKQCDSAAAWLCVTARRLAYNHQKRTRGRKVREIPVDFQSAESSGYEKCRWSTEAEYLEELTESQRRSLHEKIMVQLMEKNPRWHEAIMLVCILERSQTDAAQSMGMTEDAFYVMLHRARTWIRKKYGVEYEEMKQF